MSSHQDLKDLEVRCVLIALSDGQLLLPSSCVAEVVSYQPPQPVDEAPHWLQGRIDWRGEAIPLVELESLLRLSTGTPGPRSRIVVLNALGDDPRFAYYGILAQGVPRLARVNLDNIIAGDSPREKAFVKQTVKVASDDALIPDLDALEALVRTVFSDTPRTRNGS